MLKGFFTTWKPFVVGTPFPEPDSGYQVQKKDGKYLITSSAGGVTSTSTLSEDLTIEQVTATSTNLNMVMHPHFTKTPNGRLLSEIDGEYNKNPYSMQVDYMEVQGLKLPKTLKLTSGSSDFEWTFSDYVLNKH